MGGVVRWCRIELRAVLERRFGVRLAERTMGEILRRLGFALLPARPRHPQSDGEAQAVYGKLRRTRARRCPRLALGKPIEIWFQDEARVGQQGTLTRLRTRRGTRPRAPEDCRYACA